MSQNTHSLRNYRGGTDLISLKLCIKDKEFPANIHLAETFNWINAFIPVKNLARCNTSLLTLPTEALKQN